MEAFERVIFGNDDQIHFVQTSLRLDFGSFKQKTGERIDDVSKRYNHMLSRIMKYDLDWEDIEKKVTFLLGLHYECDDVSHQEYVEINGTVSLVDGLGKWQCMSSAASSPSRSCIHSLAPKRLGQR